MHIDKSDNIYDISFSAESEQESIELSGMSCIESLRQAKADSASMIFSVVNNKTVLSVGVISKDNFMTLFTSSEKHSIAYIRLCSKALREEARKRGFIYTRITYWHTNARKFLRHIGFYMSSKIGGEETWVLEQKQ